MFDFTDIADYAKNAHREGQRIKWYLEFTGTKQVGNYELCFAAYVEDSEQPALKAPVDQMYSWMRPLIAERMCEIEEHFWVPDRFLISTAINYHKSHKPIAMAYLIECGITTGWELLKYHQSMDGDNKIQDFERTMSKLSDIDLITFDYNDGKWREVHNYRLQLSFPNTMYEFMDSMIEDLKFELKGKSDDQTRR